MGCRTGPTYRPRHELACGDGWPDPDADAERAQRRGYTRWPSPAHQPGSTRTGAHPRRMAARAAPGLLPALCASAAAGRAARGPPRSRRAGSGRHSGRAEPPLGAFGAITRAGGGQLCASRARLTAGWGHGGAGRPVMPGQGRLTERTPTPPTSSGTCGGQARREASRGSSRSPRPASRRLAERRRLLARRAARRLGVPIGGYQVVKKWLSYREPDVLGRPLTTAEAREVTGMVRRLAAIVADAARAGRELSCYPGQRLPVRSGPSDPR